MISSTNQSGTTPATDFTQTLRYKVGPGLIIFGNLGILVGVLLGFVGVGAATIGAIVIGGEIVSLASIVFLGKEGFKAIKFKAVAFVKSGYVAPWEKSATTSASPCCAPAS